MQYCRLFQLMFGTGVCPISTIVYDDQKCDGNELMNLFIALINLGQWFSTFLLAGGTMNIKNNFTAHLGSYFFKQLEKMLILQIAHETS
jgi:hypothetical protein